MGSCAFSSYLSARRIPKHQIGFQNDFRKILALTSVLIYVEEFFIDQNLVLGWSDITIAHHRLVDLEVDVAPAAVCRMCIGNLQHLPCTTLRKFLQLNGRSEFWG